jgi:hypothetical protein
MPFDLTFVARGVEVRFSGRCDVTEVLEVRERIYSHHYEEGFQYVIVDFSCAEFLDLATVDLLRIAEQDRQYLLRNPGHLVAVIAPQAPIAGLMRTFRHFMEGTALQFHVINTREAALMCLRSQALESA